VLENRAASGRRSGAEAETEAAKLERALLVISRFEISAEPFLLAFSLAQIIRVFVACSIGANYDEAVRRRSKGAYGMRLRNVELGGTPFRSEIGRQDVFHERERGLPVYAVLLDDLLRETVYVDRALVGGKAQSSAVRVECQAVDVRFVDSSPQLLDFVAVRAVEDPDQGALFAGRRELRAIPIERDLAELTVVRRHDLSRFEVVVLDMYTPRFDAGHREDVAAAGTESAQTSGILHGLELMKQLKVREIIYIHLVLQHHHNPISAQFDCLHVTLELQFCNALVLKIIPYHHLVRWESWILAASNNGQNVAPEEHLHDSNASIASLEASVKSLLERVAVADEEASVRATCKASIILVESNIQQLAAGAARKKHRSHCGVLQSKRS